MNIQWAAIVFTCVVMISLSVSTFRYKRAYEEVLERAEAAERQVTLLRLSEEKLTLALRDQTEKAQAAQAKTKVVYKTIQKEVAKDATARDWYHTAIPESLIRVLKDSAGTD